MIKDPVSQVFSWINKVMEINFIVHIEHHA